MDEEKRRYELCFLLEPDLSEEEAQRKMDQIKSVIGDTGGEISSSHGPFRQQLAYSIRKMRQGLLARFVFSLVPSKLKELEKKVKAEPKIMRMLTVKYEADAGPRRQQRIISPKPFPGMKPEIPAEKPSVEEIDKRLEEIIK